MTSSNEWQNRRVLVTGGAGFIGSHLVDELVTRRAKVRVLDNLSTGHRRNLAASADRIELLETDLRDADGCAAACEGVAVVFHQAALGSVPRSLEDPATTIDVNVRGTACLLAAARAAGARRVVYASSSSVYGDSPSLPRREGEEGSPLSPYAASKQMTEQLARVFADCYGLQVVGLRYFNVYGPRQDPHGPYAAVIPSFLRAHLEGRPPRIHGDGAQTRDFTYVADVVRANLLAATAPERATGAAYNVGSGRSTTIAQLARLVGRVLQSDLAPEHGPERSGDVRHSTADLELARASLGYTPAVEIEPGLETCGRAYRASGDEAPGADEEEA